MLKIALFVLVIASSLFIANSALGPVTTQADWVGTYFIQTSDCVAISCGFQVGSLLKITAGSTSTTVKIAGTIASTLADALKTSGKLTIVSDVCSYGTKTENTEVSGKFPISVAATVLEGGDCTVDNIACKLGGGSAQVDTKPTFEKDKTITDKAMPFKITYQQKNILTSEPATEKATADDRACIISGVQLDATEKGTGVNGTYNISASTCGDCKYKVNTNLTIKPDTTDAYKQTLAGTLDEKTTGSSCSGKLTASMTCYLTKGILYGCGGADADGITIARAETATGSKNYTLTMSWKDSAGSTACTTSGSDTMGISASGSGSTNAFKMAAGFGMMFALALMVLFK